MAKETCSKCGRELEQNRKDKQRYCKTCHAQHMRENRPSHSELPEDVRKRANCRAYANVYLRRGKLTKGPCVVCGSLESEMHHADYDEPLQVTWLCRDHHLTLHKIKNGMPFAPRFS